MKNIASQEIQQDYLVSIDAVQKHVDDLRALYQQIENDYKDIEAAEAASDQIAYSNAKSNLEKHRQQLIGKLWELGVEAIGYYNALGGNPQRQIV
jgi:DNA repair ATPase RecN